MRRCLMIPVAVLLTGCDIIGPKEPTFLLETEAQQYQPGALVEMKLTNAHGGRRRFSLCPQVLEVDRGIWVPHPDSPPESACVAGSGQLGPADFREIHLQLPTSLQPGLRYRWRLPNAANTSSNSFTVVAPPQPPPIVVVTPPGGGS